MKRILNDQLLFVGRRKFLIVRNGSNIAPAEVEEALKRHPGVRDVAVFGIADPETGERVAAIIALSDGVSSAAVPEIMSAASKHLADYKLPEKMTVVDAIPRNAVGKVERETLQFLLNPPS